MPAPHQFSIAGGRIRAGRRVEMGGIRVGELPVARKALNRIAVRDEYCAPTTDTLGQHFFGRHDRVPCQRGDVIERGDWGAVCVSDVPERGRFARVCTCQWIAASRAVGFSGISKCFLVPLPALVTVLTGCRKGFGLFILGLLARCVVFLRSLYD